MEMQIEFGGFYGYHEEYIDWRIEQFNDSIIYEDEIINYDNVDWNATFKSYAENWLNYFNHYCDLSLDFVGIDSPKYYNFRTDRIIAKVNNADINDLMLFIVDDEFKEWADPQLRSYDGFMSFYNGIDDLIERAKNDDDKAILLGMICNYLIELNEVNKDIYEIEYDIIELNNKLVENE
jgi:hypothetical protein